MSADADRILIHRLAAGELDALEEEQARARIEADSELAALLEQLQDLQSRVRASFPEPPPPGDSRAFVELMQRLTSRAVDPRASRDVAAPASAERAVTSLRDPRQAQRGRRRVRDDATARFDRSLFVQRSGGRVTDSPLLSADPGPGAHLFHLREIPRDDGLSVELEFYAGDVLAKHSEVLLVSAFAGSYLPTPGSLFGAIADRYGISFASGAPPGATRHPGGLLHFPRISCPAFDSLWVIEMRQPGQPFGLEELRSALEAIGSQLSEMLAEASSITLPLPGTGQQQLNPKDVARELLSALPKWARSARLRSVRVFTLELAHVAVLNRALDDRDFSVSSSALHSACRELGKRLQHPALSEPLRAALKDLLEIASAPEPSLRSIALEGRRIAEIVLQTLAREDRPEFGLFAAAIRDSETPRADLAIPQLQLLLTQGRAAAAGSPIDSNDAVIIAFAAIRAAELTRN